MLPGEKLKHEVIRTCIKLPISIDHECALAEIKAIPKEHWNEFRSPVHNAVESVFIKGNAPLANILEDNERAAMDYCPYLKKVIYEMLPGQPAKVLAAELRYDSIIPLHCDGFLRPDKPMNHIAKYFRDTLRLHIPLVTNSEVQFYCNGEFFHMREGEVWAIHNLVEHAVLNSHPTDKRTHLVVDIYPNDDTESYLQNCQRQAGDTKPELFQYLLLKSSMPPPARIS